MIKRGLFKNPKNQLEGNPKLSRTPAPCVADEMCVTCPSCKKTILTSELSENLSVCQTCGYHFRINARQRINIISDANTFCEIDQDMISQNRIDFPEYDKKLKNARLDSAEKDAVVCGTCKIGGYDCCLFVMEPYFMMGSMGIVVGEKITRLFEMATEKSLPVVGFTVSGGARMQEGILSLMQMAKTSGAVKRHNDAGNLYIGVLTDPTTGGVTASFATEGDIVVAEPSALIGFAGPRVIEQTIRQKLPQGFQRAEFLLEKGFLDAIVDRREQKKYLVRLLYLHEKAEQA
ncbi:MAG: acetyl-CoA carboxylase, carboxyltransferase subunit beta [Clostridiales bacterium]|nr:acetyl-CoA carboxylase, carboxyltransferase subunit beta [Clostridiales bacterium]